MLQLAICDDDPEAAETHRAIAEHCLRQAKSSGRITVYTDSANLLCDITDDRFFYDLILLDIEMPGATGMDLAKKIRPFLQDVKIIFITSHREYAIDAFELSIFRYVPKDDLEQRLPSAVLDALKLLQLEDGRTYTIQTNSRIERISYRNIYSIERDGKMPPSSPGMAFPRYEKASSRFSRSWRRRNFSLLTGAVLSISSMLCRLRMAWCS